jgi:hypothetical protein
MNKFNVGDEVLFEGNKGLVRDMATFHEETEYAVEFYDSDGMENLWGCSSVDGTYDLIPEGKGKWIMEEHLKTATE